MRSREEQKTGVGDDAAGVPGVDDDRVQLENLEAVADGGRKLADAQNQLGELIEVGFGATAKAVQQRTNAAAFYQFKSVHVVEGRHEHRAAIENLKQPPTKTEDDHEAEAFVWLRTDEDFDAAFYLWGNDYPFTGIGS